MPLRTLQSSRAPADAADIQCLVGMDSHPVATIHQGEVLNE